VRKLWYAGAVVAGGIFLFGAAAPAQADVLPGTGTAGQQADDQLTDLLGQTNGVNLENPLRYSTIGGSPLGSRPVLQFKSGQNSPDLNPLLPGESTQESGPGIGNTELPQADVVGAPQRLGDGLPVRNVNVQQLPLQNLPLLGLLGGLLPNGGTPSLGQRPTMRQAEYFDGGMPLLGGLGGLLPANTLPRSGDGPDIPGVPDASGLPAGGIAIVPAATTPTFGQPAANQPAAAQPAAAQPAPQGKPAAQDKPQRPKPVVTPDDPRLHEEPIDTDATAPRRAFSPDGRPVAGIDEQYR